jgi:hypothetical protein
MPGHGIKDVETLTAGAPMHEILTVAAVPSPRSRRLRRLVLGTAFLLALTVWLVPRVPVVGAQTPDTAASKSAPGQPAPTAGARGDEKAARAGDSTDFSARIDIRKDKSGNNVITIEKGGDAADGAAKSGRKIITIEKSGIAVENENADAEAAGANADSTGKKPASKAGKRIRIDGIGSDQEYDSFEAFVHDQPEVAGMVIAIVAVIFLSPVLAIGLVLWYRFRKARMMNETMLKLAEKGVVPPAEAFGALAGGKQEATVMAAAATAPVYEQVKQIRRRAAWSDLRKGVIMGAIGLALTAHSGFDSGSANALGLVLLFVGIGYVVLWWFEDRQMGATRAPTPSAGSGPTAPPAPPAA